MSPLLQSLVAEIDDPSRPDLKAVAGSIQRRLRALGQKAQQELLTEVTRWRYGLAPVSDPQWSLQQIVFQLLWQTIGAPITETADECALRNQIKKSNPPKASELDIARSAGWQ